MALSALEILEIVVSKGPALASAIGKAVDAEQAAKSVVEKVKASQEVQLVLADIVDAVIAANAS